MTNSNTKRASVSFDVYPSDAKLIRRIVARARKDDPAIDALSLSMDLTACHANYNPLRLADLLAADDFNFRHDIYGIINCMNRETGQLVRNFSPRFSMPEPRS